VDDSLQLAVVWEMFEGDTLARAVHGVLQWEAGEA
jgi:hypothetical protein